jgi:hypothetical protein
MKKEKKDIKQKRLEHIRLSWWLIERKIMYYYPEMIKEEFHDKLVTDDDLYDQRERRYLNLCLELGIENTVAHHGFDDIGEVAGKGMFEVDFSRHCVALILKKYGIENANELKPEIPTIIN